MSAKIKTRQTSSKNTTNCFDRLSQPNTQNDTEKEKKIKSVPLAALKSRPILEKRETKVTPPKAPDCVLKTQHSDTPPSNTEQQLSNDTTNENKTDNTIKAIIRNQVVETGSNNALVINIETYNNAPSNVCFINLPDNTAAYVKIKALSVNTDDGESVSVVAKSFTFKNTSKNGLTISEPYNIVNNSDNFNGDFILTQQNTEIIENEDTNNNDNKQKIIRQIGLSVVGTDAKIRWLISLFVMKIEFAPLNFSETENAVTPQHS